MVGAQSLPSRATSLLGGQDWAPPHLFCGAVGHMWKTTTLQREPHGYKGITLNTLNLWKGEV